MRRFTYGPDVCWDGMPLSIQIGRAQMKFSIKSAWFFGSDGRHFTICLITQSLHSDWYRSLCGTLFWPALPDHPCGGWLLSQHYQVS